jgi:lipopolysaccharide transport system permease protein
MNNHSRKIQEVIYTPDSAIHRPRQMLQEIYNDLFSSGELAWRLMIRNIQGKYRQAFFGMSWAIIPPIVTAVGLSWASNSGILNVGETEIPYPAYVMLGMVLWQTFTEAFNAPQTAIKDAKALLAQVKFPHEAIILSQLGEICFNLVIKLLVTIVIFLVFQAPLHWMLPLSIFPIILLIMLGTALGLLLVPFINLVEDVSRSIEIAILIWFLLTPVTYPSPPDGILGAISRLNPVSPLLGGARGLITTGLLEMPTGFWVMLLLTPLIFMLGWLVYRLSIPFIVERIT